MIERGVVIQQFNAAPLDFLVDTLAVDPPIHARVSCRVRQEPGV
jgi:hypothetical protein